MVFGREPAVFFNAVAAFLALLSSLVVPLTVEQQGALNAAIVLITGAVIAYKVSAEKALALLSGVVQALIAVALAFGAHWSPESQSSVLVFVSAVVAFVVRDRVVAPKDVAGGDVPTVPAV